MWSFGPLHLNFFGIAVAAGILAAAMWAARAADRRGMTGDIMYDVTLWALIGGVIGARLAHVMLEWSHYVQDPLSILYVWRGGLSLHGGLIGGGLATWFYTKRKAVSFLPIVDVLATALPLGQAIGRVGCDIFGSPTTVPWAVTVAGATVHPQQVYELLFDWGIFLILARASKLTEKGSSSGWYRPGYLAIGYAFQYSLGRFGVEFFRPSRMLGPLSDGQWVSLAIMAVSIILFAVLSKGSLKNQKPISKSTNVRVRRTLLVDPITESLEQYRWVRDWSVAVGTPVLLIAVYYWRVGAGIV